MKETAMAKTDTTKRATQSTQPVRSSTSAGQHNSLQKQYDDVAAEHAAAVVSMQELANKKNQLLRKIRELKEPKTDA